MEEERRQGNERRQRKERLLTSGYAACRYSAEEEVGRGPSCGGSERGGGGPCLLVKMFFLKCNVSALQSTAAHVLCMCVCVSVCV